MAGPARGMGGSGFRPPSLQGTGPRIAAALGALWLVELLLRAAGLDPIRWLAWISWGPGFIPWGVLTWPLVQGSSVLGVLIGLYIIASIVPSVLAGYDQRKSREALGAIYAGGVLAGVVGQVLSVATGLPIATGSTLGWNHLFAGLFALFGLRTPEGTVHLNFVLPIQARWFVWLSVGIPALMWLAALPRGMTLGPVVSMGCWAGAWWWFHNRSFRSPRGGRKRRAELKRKARKIEHELKVLRGGKDDDSYH